MSKKRKADETDETEEGTEPREGKDVSKAAVTNAEGVQHFILSRGGMLSAHDEEAIGVMLEKLGLDPKGDAATQPEEVEEEQLPPSAETLPAKVEPEAVGDGEVPPPPSVPPQNES